MMSPISLNGKMAYSIKPVKLQIVRNVSAEMNDTDTRLVEAYRAADVAEAHMIRLALEVAGIHSQIDGEALQGSEYPLGWSTAPRILVAESLVAQAREIIAQAHPHRGIFGGEDSNAELLRCLACGQAMEKTETCPACGWTYKTERE